MATLKGIATVPNTGGTLDFTNYNSNVEVSQETGNFSGYGWSTDLGWVAFGTTDNEEGPVSVNLETGAVAGKAKVLNTEEFLDFTGHNSNVEIDIGTRIFSGYVWSEDIGWIKFTDNDVFLEGWFLSLILGDSLSLTYSLANITSLRISDGINIAESSDVWIGGHLLLDLFDMVGIVVSNLTRSGNNVHLSFQELMNLEEEFSNIVSRRSADLTFLRSHIY